MSSDKSGLVKCRTCAETKPKKRAEKNPRGGFRYRDDHGNAWCGRRCHSCTCKDQFYRARTSGRNVGREQSKYYKMRKGFESECLAKIFFETKGYSVSQALMHGPDLILKKDESIQTCEVKTIFKTKWGIYSPKVSPKRKQDDLIALVWPTGFISFCSMEEHLSKCGPGGYRRFN